MLWRRPRSNTAAFSTPTDDVIRVKTELVQTDVTVLDKQGALSRLETSSLNCRQQTQTLTFPNNCRQEARKRSGKRGGNLTPLRRKAGEKRGLGIKSYLDFLLV